MPIASRKEERAAIVALLESGEYEDADKLAGAIFKTTFDLLQRRELWAFQFKLGAMLLAYGPFASSKDALKAAEAAGTGLTAIGKLYPVTGLLDTMAKLDAPLRELCECRHYVDIHMDKGASPGCPVKNCGCGRRY